MERQAPRQILYENQLPLAIESKSTRRLFFPEGGSVYGPTGNTSGHPNIVRIPINADSLLDVQHSYLQFKIRNENAVANNGIGPDFGVPFIRRLRIESGGTTLEDIEEYGKLYGGVLFPTQASVGAVQDSSITTGGIGATAGALSDVLPQTIADGDVKMDAGAQVAAGDVGNAGDIATAIAEAVKNAGNTLAGKLEGQTNGMTISGASTIAGLKHSLPSKLGPSEEITYNVPLVSALMNMDKYLPLVMLNAGLVLELELDVVNSLGIATADSRGAQVYGGANCNWSMRDVRYVAHLIDLQRDFYDKMRMVMEGSGGVLQLAGSTFRHYSGNSVTADTDVTINIPARVKSIKSVFFTHTRSSDKGANNRFYIDSVPNNMSEYQFRIGSVVYPPTSVKLTATAHDGKYTNKGEAYSELRKAFGTLGDYSEGGVALSNDTFLSGEPSANKPDVPTTTAGNTEPQQPLFNPFGLDFEAFPKTALESGVNSADRSLPMSLEIKKVSGNGPDAVNTDVWVMCDAIFYVNLDGSISVSI